MQRCYTRQLLKFVPGLTLIRSLLKAGTIYHPLAATFVPPPLLLSFLALEVGKRHKKSQSKYLTLLASMMEPVVGSFPMKIKPVFPRIVLSIGSGEAALFPLLQVIRTWCILPVAYSLEHEKDLFNMGTKQMQTAERHGDRARMRPRVQARNSQHRNSLDQVNPAPSLPFLRLGFIN